MRHLKKLSRPARCHLQRLLPWLLTLPLILLGTANTARAQNELGVFWDPGFTESETSTSSFPGVIEGYLVVQNLVGTAGVAGWELALEVQGHADFVYWDLDGQEINLVSPPSFVVGLAAPLLPVGGAVRLATFRLLVNDAPPISILAGPVARPSVPGEIVFIPADRPTDLEPLGTVSGTPVVGWVNRYNPRPELSVNEIDFGTQPLNQNITRTFTITNAGDNNLELDLRLSAGCSGFALTGASGPVTLLPGAVTIVAVGFTPTAIGPYACEVELGDQLPRVALAGVGREPIFSYTVSSVRYFGEVAVGSYRDLTSMFRNTGEVPIDIVPELIGCGADFAIITAGEPVTVYPQGARLVNVRFQPQSAGEFVCALGFGGTLDQIELQGTGRAPLLRFEVTSALNFGTVAVGAQRDLNATVRNTGEASFTITPGLAGCSEAFSLPNGTDPVTLGAGQYANVLVRFQPAAIDSFGCLLDLGPTVGQVPVSGASHVPVVSWIAPTSVNFGPLQVGATLDRTVQIYNTGEVPFAVSPSLAGCGPEFQIVADSGPAVINPGGLRQIAVRFVPDSETGFTCVLGLGTTVPGVTLSGTGIPPVPGWQITPAALAFPVTSPGAFRELTVQIKNTGLTILELDIRLADPALPYSIVSGGGAAQLAPNQIRSVTVRFAPMSDGPFATTLVLGGLLPGVPVSGTAGEVVQACNVVPNVLDFGSVAVGNTISRTFTVTNTGNQVLNVTPATVSPHYHVTPNPGPLAPGQTRVVWVHFNPSQDGNWDGVITLGTPTCPTVACIGEATYQPVPGSDKLGIYFDPAYTNNQLELAPFVIQRAYLVLLGPSVPTGVSGWECRLDIVGDAIVTSWQYPPSSLNVGTFPDLVVGLAVPLPHGTVVRLASLDFLLFSANGPVAFMVTPISTPSIPGEMVWAAGGTNDLVPMRSITGQPLVAQVNAGGLVGIQAPTPLLVASGRLVQLSWPAPPEPGVGCQVYRRPDGGASELLTPEPLSSTGTSLQFSDEPAGFAPGTRLYYSYAVVVGGTERVRSPEVMYTMPSLPAARTRLLPNYPNPFNPETTIRFELAEPGPARVAIYDVTGRQVAVLVDEQLGAGTQSRIWQGRDASGRTVASGAYYVRLTARNQVDHQKILLLK